MLSLLLHLILVGAGPIADAHLELESYAADHAPVHVEDADAPPCGSGHTHQVCLIKALQSMDTPPEDAAPAVVPVVLALRPPSAPLVAPTAALAVSSLGSRAPPAA